MNSTATKTLARNKRAIRSADQGVFILPEQSKGNARCLGFWSGCQCKKCLTREAFETWEIVRECVRGLK